jgi:hypothetical protein
MVAVANPPRPRPIGSSSAPKSRIAAGTLVLFGVPALLFLVFAWQLFSGMVRTEIAVRDAVAVSRVTLEADQTGSRIDFVLVDRVGHDTTASGSLNVKLREPDGTVWQTTRSVSAADFTPIAEGSLLAGRTGYSVTIPASDWLRAPRRGGAATVTVSVSPNDGTPFSTVSEERFP